MNSLVLKLKSTLGDCKRAVSSKCSKATSYVSSFDPVFFIFDDKNEEPVNFVRAGEEFQLIVRNQDRQELWLVKTDKCLFTDEHKKCDCILIGDEKVFFIEIKHAKNRGEQRSRAVAQLSSTIDLLRDNHIDLSNYESKAIICFKSGRTRPIQASLNSQRAAFFANYKILLEEGNEIVF